MSPDVDQSVRLALGTTRQLCLRRTANGIAIEIEPRTHTAVDTVLGTALGLAAAGVGYSVLPRTIGAVLLALGMFIVGFYVNAAGPFTPTTEGQPDA